MKQKLLKSLFLLFALAAGSTNAWAEDVILTAGTNGTACTVNEKDGIKVGTSKLGGTMTITVPANTITLYLHAAAWKGVTGLSLNITGATVSPESIELTPDDGISNNSPFTLSGNEDDFKFEISLTDVTDETTLTLESSTGKRFVVWDASAVVSSGGDVTPTCATPTFSPAAGTYTTAQSVAISTTTEGATIYYTVDGSDPTVESTVYTEAITVSETTTIKAFAAKEGCNSSAVASATYTIVSIEHAGTVDDPYTVADARTAIDAGTGITGVYATGIVSKIVTAFNPTYGNISYNISADGTEEADQLQAYRGFSYDGEWFTSADDIQVGDVVVVYGNLTKYGSTYEFAANNQLVSLDRPVVTTPTITVDPTSLTGFTYEVENGPSEAQSILISGSNLTTQISAALDDNSNFEFSFSEDGDYFSDSSIGIAPEISTLRVYVRMKADLAVGEYSGTITLTSEDAETVTVALAGSVTAPEAANFVWDLSIDQTKTATEEEMTWESDYATMAVNKGGASTKTNNYYPGTEGKTYTSTRFYKNSGLIITPALGYEITSVVFEATSDSYASALKNSEWTNATATVSGTTVTVTPTDGSTDFYAVIGSTCGFTSVKVYYQELSDFAPIWSALPTPTITAGETYEFYPGSYITAMPAPSITLATEVSSDLYGYEDGYFVFSSDAAGEYAFTFTATNPEGSASATLTITVEAAVASISLGDNEINAPAEGTDGVIIVDYENITNVAAEVFFCDADGNAATYDWVIASINSINNVEYIIDANESTDPRTAYMKVYALDDNANDVYSELITITQAGYVVDYATLPFAWNGGTKDELLAETGVTANGLGSDYAASNAPYRVKLDTDGDYIQVKTDSQPVLVSLDVKMLGGSNTSTITVQESADGETFTDVEDLTIEGVQNDVLYLQTANAFSAETRYVRFYFTKGSNVGVGGITIENTFEEVATVGAVGYATYVSNYNVSFPEGVEAYITSEINTEQGYVLMTQVTAVPKGTPVVLKGEEGTYTLDIAAGELDDVTGNLLKASDGTVVGDGTRYALGNGNQSIGFYRVKEGTLIAAGKAYLEIPKTDGADVKGFSLVFGDDATSINEELRMKSEEFNEGAIYDLSGRKINGQSSILNGQLPKGIYIVNGKKIAIK